MCCDSLPSEVRQLTIINEDKATLISIVIFLNSSKAMFCFTHGLTLPYEAGYFLYHLHKPCFTDTHLIQTPHYYEALPGGGVHVARLNFKMSRVSVYKCLSVIVGFAVTVAIWPREVVSCLNFIIRAVATFWALSLVGIYPGSASITDSLLCPFNTDTFCGPLRVHINGVCLYFSFYQSF